MTYQERFEIIKDKQLHMHALSPFEIGWLIGLAERAQKLEEENKRYREALEEIEQANYWDYGEEWMHQELQSKARKALEESE